jgi:choline dehydrogenase-like flavoprotein
MATKLNPVDVLIVGLGWTGGIIAKELASTKLKIVALERGGPRDTNPDFIDPEIHDELRYAARHDLIRSKRPAAPPARPAISTARKSTAAISSRARVKKIIPTRQ